MTTLSSSLIARGYDCNLFFFAEGPLRVQEVGAHHIIRGDLAALMEWVSQSGTDIVHAKTLDWFTGISAIRLLSHRPKLVLTHHGITSHNWNSSNCDALVGCSRWGAEEQQRSTDLTVRVAANGIDLLQFRPMEDGSGPPIVAWVGRAGDLKQKRIDRLSAIAGNLVRSGFRIWIADPDGPRSLPGAISQPLVSHAERWEKIAPEAIATFYQEVAKSGGCLLSTSSYEGLPLALIEAQACGCPVIGTHVRGVDEAVSPEGGGLLFSEDIGPHQLSELISTTIRDHEGMAIRRRRARAYAAAHFSIERMTTEYVEIYARVTSTRRPPDSSWLRLPAKGTLQQLMAEHWLPGHQQWAASRVLARQGHWDLAAIALRSALATYPPLLARPSRIPHVVRILSRRAGCLNIRVQRTSQRARLAEREL